METDNKSDEQVGFGRPHKEPIASDFSSSSKSYNSNLEGNDRLDAFSRRRFLEKLSIGLGGIAAAIIGIPVVGFLLSPLFEKVPEAWRPVGSVDSFRVGTTTAVIFKNASPLPWAGVTANSAAWLRRENEQQFMAFSINCTHLGCPVRWLPDANLFMCPCHGGVYYEDGEVAAGPPPRPLPRYSVRVRNGQVEILASPIPLTTT